MTAQSVFTGLAQDATVKTAIPVARDQFKPTDVVMRATTSLAQYNALGTQVMLTFEMTGFASFCIQFLGDTNGFIIQGSNDLIQWTQIDTRALGGWEAPTGNVFLQDNLAPILVAGNKQTRFVRVSTNGVPSSSRVSSVVALLSQVPIAPMKPQRSYGPDTAWSYVPPSGGIVNTTAVTVKTAIAASKRNIVTNMQLDNGGATGTEVILTDVGASAVVWRGYAPPGSSRQVSFDPPLRLTANSALSVTLTAASGAAVYPNIQGIVGLA